MKEKGSKPHVEVKVNNVDTLFAPEEISAMVLIKMKEVAEAYLGKTVSLSSIVYKTKQPLYVN